MPNVDFDDPLIFIQQVKVFTYPVKYLNIYQWFCTTFCTDIVPQRMNPHDFDDLSSSAIMMLKLMVLSETS